MTPNIGNIYQTKALRETSWYVPISKTHDDREERNGRLKPWSKTSLAPTTSGDSMMTTRMGSCFPGSEKAFCTDHVPRVGLTQAKRRWERREVMASREALPTDGRIWAFLNLGPEVLGPYDDLSSTCAGPCSPELLIVAGLACMEKRKMREIERGGERKGNVGWGGTLRVASLKKKIPNLQNGPQTSN